LPAHQSDADRLLKNFKNKQMKDIEQRLKLEAAELSSLIKGKPSLHEISKDSFDRQSEFSFKRGETVTSKTPSSKPAALSK
jgi:hypothetical protein